MEDQELAPAGYYGAFPSKEKGAPYGILWDGPWEQPFDSFGQVTRRMVRAIRDAGMPVFVKMRGSAGSVLNNDVEPVVLKELGCSLNTEAMSASEDRKPVWNADGPLSQLVDRCLVSIHHSVPRYDSLRSILEPSSFRFADRSEVEKTYRFRILMTALETDRVPDRAAIELMKKFGQVWVPCTRNFQVLMQHGVTNVRVVPHPMPQDRRYDLAGAKQRANKNGHGKYVFYNIGKWEPRKNHLGLMRAFLRMHGPAMNGAVLMIKTSRYGDYAGYPKTPEEALSIALQDQRVKDFGWTLEYAKKHVLWNTKFMSEDEIVGFHGFGDCYVSASHGEAWDMPAFDALVAGSRIVHVGFGGTEDYAYSALWNGETEPAHPGYRWGMARWAKVDEDALSKDMMSIFNRRGTQENFLKEGFLESCRMKSVGKLAKSLIMEVAGVTQEKLNEWSIPAR